jgi:raw score 8.25
MNSKKSYLAIFGIILAVGLMASAFILGSQFKNLRQTGSI